MNKYKFNITWQTQCRGYISPIIEALTEEEAREILDDTLILDFNKNARADTEWDIDSVELINE